MDDSRRPSVLLSQQPKLVLVGHRYTKPGTRDDALLASCQVSHVDLLLNSADGERAKVGCGTRDVSEIARNIAVWNHKWWRMKTSCGAIFRKPALRVPTKVHVHRLHLDNACALRRVYMFTGLGFEALLRLRRV